MTLAVVGMLNTITTIQFVSVDFLLCNNKEKQNVVTRQCYLYCLCSRVMAHSQPGASLLSSGPGFGGFVQNRFPSLVEGFSTSKPEIYINSLQAG